MAMVFALLGVKETVFTIMVAVIYILMKMWVRIDLSKQYQSCAIPPKRYLVAFGVMFATIYAIGVAFYAMVGDFGANSNGLMIFFASSVVLFVLGNHINEILMLRNSTSHRSITSIEAVFNSFFGAIAMLMLLISYLMIAMLSWRAFIPYLAIVSACYCVVFYIPARTVEFYRKKDDNEYIEVTNGL